MADELNQLPPVNEPSSDQHSNLAPGLDNELDSALGEMFKNEPSAPTQAPLEKAPEKAPEKAVETPEPEKTPEPEAKKEDAKTPGKPETEKPLLTVDQIDKMEPKKQDAWTALKNNNKRANRVIDEKDREITKLKTTLAEKGSATTKEVEELKKQIQELGKYRAMVDVQADPEFISKYDEPIGKSVETMKSMLASMDVSDEITSKIDFSNTKLMDQVISHIEKHRDRFTAGKFERTYKAFLELADKREETLGEWKENSSKFLEEKKKEAFTRDAEAEGKMVQHLSQISDAKDKEGNQMFPFLNKVEAREGASQAEIDRAANHNKLVDSLTQKVHSILKSNKPEERTEFAVAAVASIYLTAQLRAAFGKIKGLEEELSKVSKVSSEDDRTKNRAPNRNNGGASLGEVDVDSALAAHSWNS